MELLIQNGMLRQFIVSVSLDFLALLKILAQSFLLIAWAHLILYGEEATKQAQKAGEEAAAAYDREKKDIAEGKIPEKKPKTKSNKGEDGSKPKKRGRKKRLSTEDNEGEKKKEEKLLPIIQKGVSKVSRVGE